MKNDNRTNQLATTPARRKKTATKTDVQAPALWEAVDWDSIDWEGICNDYRRMVGYSNAHFAKSIEQILVERFAIDFKRRLTMELQALGRVKRGKSGYNIKEVFEELYPTDAEAEQ
jgi:hypothetical protein